MKLTYEFARPIKMDQNASDLPPMSPSSRKNSRYKNYLAWKGVACKVHGLKYFKIDTLSIKVVPDDLYNDYNNLAQT